MLYHRKFQWSSLCAFQISLQFSAVHSLKVLEAVDSTCPSGERLQGCTTNSCTITDGDKQCEYHCSCSQQLCYIFLLRDGDSGTIINVCNINITCCNNEII